MVRATQVDTVLHTHLEVDSTRVSSRRLHEVNVIGTMNLLAAAAAEGSAVRKVVLKTSTLVYGSNFDDPYFFRETTRRTHPPTTPVERSLLEVDALVARLRRGQPRRGGHLAAVRQRARRRRHHGVLAHAAHAGRARGVRLRPAPAVRARGRRHPRARARDRPPTSPARSTWPGPGIITWSEACRAVGAPPAGDAAGAHRRRPRCRCGCCGSIDIPPEVLSLLRYGRGVDTTAFVDTGFEYGYTTPATVEAFAEARRLERVVGAPPEYEYEHDVEDFFRNSRAVVHPEG